MSEQDGELIARLRREAVNWSASCGGLFDEAADEIGALRAKLKGIEIALARDESIDAAMKIVRSERAHGAASAREE